MDDPSIGTAGLEDVPTLVDTLEEENNTKRNILFYRNILSTEVSLVIPRYDWTTSTVYAQYTDDVLLWGDTPKKFYVLSLDDNEYSVYLCLSNNHGAASTIPPSGTNTEAIETADGYVWKYSYTLTEEMESFLTTTSIPIVPIDRLSYTDERALALDVKLDAISGSLQRIQVDYSTDVFTDLVNVNLQNTHTVLNTDTDLLTFIVDLKTGLSTSDNYYNTNYVVYFDSGRVGTIETYTVNNDNTATIVLCEIYPSGNSDGDILIGDRYSIIPKVPIGGNGTGAIAIPIFTNNILTDIQLISGGTGYSFATASLLTSDSTILNVVVNPTGGLGFNLLEEYKPTDIMIMKTLSYNEFSTTDVKFFTPSANIRQYGLIKNITDFEDNDAVELTPSYNVTLAINPTYVRGSGNQFNTFGFNTSVGASTVYTPVISITNLNTWTHIIGASSLAGALVIEDSVVLSSDENLVINLKVRKPALQFFEAKTVNDVDILGEFIGVISSKATEVSVGTPLVVEHPEALTIINIDGVPNYGSARPEASNIVKIKLNRTGFTVLNTNIVPIGSYLLSSEGASGYVVSLDAAIVVGPNCYAYAYVLMEKGEFSPSDELICVVDPFVVPTTLFDGTCAGNSGITITSDTLAYYNDTIVDKYSGKVLYTQNTEPIQLTTDSRFTNRILLSF